MKYKIVHKQHNSLNCFVCGYDNKFGLKASFYQTENKELIAIFNPLNEHQSYPGILHGGISSAILDETIGRAILSVCGEETWGMTIELNLKYKKPVPLDSEIKVIGRITNSEGRIFIGTGEIILPNGEIAVTAEGKYLKIPMNKMVNQDFLQNEWTLINSDKDYKEINI